MKKKKPKIGNYIFIAMANAIAEKKVDAKRRRWRKKRPLDKY